MCAAAAPGCTRGSAAPRRGADARGPRQISGEKVQCSRARRSHDGISSARFSARTRAWLKRRSLTGPPRGPLRSKALICGRKVQCSISFWSCRRRVGSSVSVGRGGGGWQGSRGGAGLGENCEQAAWPDQGGGHAGGGAFLFSRPGEKRQRRSPGWR